MIVYIFHWLQRCLHADDYVPTLTAITATTNKGFLYRGVDDSELATNFLQEMLKSIPLMVEYDETLTSSELEEQLTLAKLLTSSVWLNLLNKSTESQQGLILPYLKSFP